MTREEAERVAAVWTARLGFRGDDWSSGAAVFARAGEAHRAMVRAEDGRPVFVRGLVGMARAARVARAAT